LTALTPRVPRLTIFAKEARCNGSGDREFDVNVKATLSPDDLARACAEAMWKDDEASPGLGMEIVEIGPGKATLAMTIRPDMVNGQRIAHGGFIFTLADSAFAFACNTHNERVVAAQGNITFIRPGKLGDRLIANAREISRSGRSGIYDVRVTVGDIVIAEFRGHSRAIGGTWLPVVDTDTPER
jgi:acyl-CoA thioesterase